MYKWGNDWAGLRARDGLWDAFMVTPCRTQPTHVHQGVRGTGAPCKSECVKSAGKWGRVFSNTACKAQPGWVRAAQEEAEKGG